MSCGSKKLLGFRGAMLAAGMMWGTASTALAGSPAHEQDKQKRVEIQKKVEKHKTVEVQKRTHSGDARGGRGEWRDDEHRRDSERQKWLARRAEANRPRYAASKQRYEARERQLEERRRQASRHGDAHWKKDERHHSRHGTGGSGWSKDKYEARQERLKDKYEARRERLKDKYEDKKRR